MTLAAISAWVGLAGLTSIPLSRSWRGDYLANKYAARHIFVGLLVAWPAMWLLLIRDRLTA